MVGLPARGKTYTARKLSRYLAWRGYKTKVFNVGNYRRDSVGAAVPATFFDPANESAAASRQKIALEALTDMLKWIRESGQVAIYDATNSTKMRRKRIRNRCARVGVRVLFIETICNDKAIVENNIIETKLTSPDYKGVASAKAVADFRARIAHYEHAYQTITSEAISYIKVIDVGRQVVSNRIQGYLMGQIVNFLMNLHISSRKIYLTRHGQSLANMKDIVGSDSDLSPLGQKYAEKLAEYVHTHLKPPYTVWTSTLKRTRQTAKAIGHSTMQIKALDEIDAGICDGLSYEEIERRWPDEFAARATDKLHYRYPRGESYDDVIERVNPLIIEIERQNFPLLVIGHQAVLRTLYAYLADKPRSEAPHLEVPLHVIIELTPKAYGCEERRISLL